MEQLLVISALAHDRPGIVNELSHTILGCDGNIIDSRMSVLGGEFAIILLVSGVESSINQLESSLAKLGQNAELTIETRRTSSPELKERIPYHIEIVAIDHPGIVYQLTNYLSKLNINIQDLNTNRYAAAHTGTAMFAVDMHVTIPAELSIQQFRDDFVHFCDDLNLDVSMRAVK